MNSAADFIRRRISSRFGEDEIIRKRGVPGDASLKWALPHANSGFKATPRLPKSRVDPQVLALTSAGVVKLWEIWGHQERPKPAAEATPEELPTELFASLERRMSTSSRSAYAPVHVPMPGHRVHRPGAS